jgi:hypothetical protein
MGVVFLKEVLEGTYDAIIVDSSDPIDKSCCRDKNGNDPLSLTSK